MIQDIELAGVASVLGLERVDYTPLAFSAQINRGLPLQSITHVHDIVAPGSTTFSGLVISKQTLSRRRKSGQALSPVESERLARIARVWTMASDVYKDENMARLFLNKPHPMLEGRIPLEVATENEYGAEAVVQTLGRLKYGSVA